MKKESIKRLVGIMGSLLVVLSLTVNGSSSYITHKVHYMWCVIT